MSVAEIYMITGGIPYYFNFLSPHKSIYQNIDDECFDISGRLIDEYSIIFSSLFKNAEDHKKVIEYISSRHKGISLDDINSSFPALKGGSMNRILDNLISSDFITRTPPLFSKTKGAIYRVTDEFVLFYLKWIKSAPKTVFTSPNILYFQSLAQGGSYKSWRGFAFERLCLKHEYQIRKALGIHKILSIPSMVYFYDDLGKRSSQIDLLFDRADHVITICEMKYSETPFKITKTDIADLTRKKEDLRQYFTQKKKAQKDLHTCYVTTEGVEQNEYFHQIQPSVVTLTDMFHNDST